MMTRRPFGTLRGALHNTFYPTGRSPVVRRLKAAKEKAAEEQQSQESSSSDSRNTEQQH